MPSFTSAIRMLDRLLALLAKAVSALSGVCLVFLVVSFGWLVFGRYVLNATPTWVEQVALLLVVTIAFLSTATNARLGVNLSVDIVPLMLPWRWRRWLLAFIDLLLAGLGLLMALRGYDLTVFSWSTKVPLINVPEGLRNLPLAIGGGLLALFCAVNAVKRFTEGEPVPSGEIEAPVKGLE